MQQLSLIDSMPTTPKELGAYYTSELVAEFLVSWAIRSSRDLVMDPSFGGGAFLRAACKRLTALGGNIFSQVLGVEIDQQAYSKTVTALRNEFGRHLVSLSCGDFFQVEPESHPADAVVGNPPFIRYQRFSGEIRKRALRRASLQGVDLNALASSWAPFLVHAISMVKPGGRLAMVVPFEISHAAYARPLLAYLSRTFGQVMLLTIEQRIFESLNEETMLLLADNKHGEGENLLWHHFSCVADLWKLLQGNNTEDLPKFTTLDHEALCQGQKRFVEYFVPVQVRSLYHELKSLPAVRTLGDLAYVGIGYVTGANDFFHLTPAQALDSKIPPRFLKPAVRRGRTFSGLHFNHDDWKVGLGPRDTGYLLHVTDHESCLTESVIHYLENGVRKGIPRAYKCRTRVPWYRVPHVSCPDAFLSYMSGHSPRLVTNQANAVAPNTLHVVRIASQSPVRAEQLVALWQTSLTALSVEIEGHSLGGGMLKMEPKEARKVLLPVAHWPGMEDFVAELDRLHRLRGPNEVRRLADREILIRRMGLSKSDCNLLRSGAQTLLARRTRPPQGIGNGR